MSWTPAIVMALASGVLLAGLGVGLLMVRRRDPVNVLFGAFSVAWGLQIAVGNVARALDMAWLVWLTSALVLPVPLFLAAFASRFARPWKSPWPDVFAVAVAAVVAGSALLLVFAPELLIAGIHPGPRGLLQEYGPLGVGVFVVPFFLAFDIAVVVLLRTWMTAREPLRMQSRILVAGLLAYVSYVSVANAWPLVRDPGLAAALGPGAWMLLPLFVLGVLVVLGSAIAIHRHRHRDWLMIGAALVPMAVAAGESALRFAGLASVESLGFWRVGMVSVIVYGIVRFQLFDIDPQLKLAVRGSTMAAFLVGAFVVVSELLESLVAVDGVAYGLIVAGGIGLALHPAQRAAERLAHAAFPGDADDPVFRRSRQEEVYLVSLEHLVAAGLHGDALTQAAERLRSRVALSPDAVGHLDRIMADAGRA